MNRQKILLDPVLPTEEETKAIKLLDKMQGMAILPVPQASSKTLLPLLMYFLAIPTQNGTFLSLKLLAAQFIIAS
ncbi:MAG TPA: hypothetical protein DCS91_23345 [Microcoleaceae bacterium UBA11344]|jgi:hypothetical protein|nr:hypothetical protein [Microcoleaceae cyanobacterium UBA11344]